MAANDKNWAQAYVIDPLNAPEPSDETGPGTHFRSTFAPPSTTSLPKNDLPTPPNSGTPVSMQSNNPFRRSSDMKEGSTGRNRASSDAYNLNSPGSPRHPRNSGQFRKEAFASYAERPRSADPSRRSIDGPRSPQFETRVRSRGNSTNETPLEFARHDAKLAHRSPHLRKKHIPGPDSIDRLDVGPGQQYHHEGPYDAALLARNSSWKHSPVAAVMGSNQEALRATPVENIRDSIERHRPLDGTAVVPPGETDRFGRKYNYKEGDNLMITNGGNYKRWDDVVGGKAKDYHPDDIKGKGEPAYSLEKALKEHKISGDHKRHGSKDDASAIEMQDQRHSIDRRDPIDIAGGQQKYAILEESVAATGSDNVASQGHQRHSSLEGLKKRIGSLRKKREA